MTSPRPAGWYVDPGDREIEIYWDGTAWDTSTARSRTSATAGSVHGPIRAVARLDNFAFLARVLAAIAGFAATFVGIGVMVGGDHRLGLGFGILVSGGVTVFMLCAIGAVCSEVAKLRQNA